MANRDNPHGLAPLMRTLSGGVPSVRHYSRDADSATAIFANDVVARDDDGNINAGGTPGTTTYQGVAMIYAPGSVAKTDIAVIDSPDALFEAQDDADTDGFAAADMGLNCNLVFGAGSTVSMISGHELDEGTIQTTNTLDVHLLRLLDVPDNAAGAHCRVEVIFNKHRLLPGVAGV